MSESTNPKPDKQKMLITVIQGQDADMAIQSLGDKGFRVTRLPSAGGFLGRKNVTLMIGVKENKAQEAIEILEQTCRQRVAFIAVPMENAPLPMPAPTPVSIGGANVFSLDVEHYEEI
jgi:uncharacterized protein YaaQ